MATDPATPTPFPDWLDCVTTLNRYATALDQRDWPLLDEVFTADATADYGNGSIEGRVAIVEMIRASLGGCGPTQHLLGNHEIELGDHEQAMGSARVRAIHVARPDSADPGATLEVLGTYVDRLVRTDHGWRIRHREMVDVTTIGDLGVLGP